MGFAISPRMITASKTVLAGSNVLRMAARDGPTSRSPRMNVSTGIVVPTTAKLAINESRGNVQSTASWPLIDAIALQTAAAAVMITAVAETGGRRGNSRLP